MSTLKSFEARNKRAKLIHDAREVVEHANVEGEIRSLSQEDKDQVAKMMEDVSSLDELITSLESIESVEVESKDSMDPAKKTDYPEENDSRRSRKSAPQSVERRTSPNEIRATPEYRKAFNDFLHGRAVPDSYRSGAPLGPGGAAGEYRDSTLSTQSAGGYLVTPTQISADVTMAINNLVFVRKLSKVESVTTAQSLGVRQMTVQPSDPSWTTEIAAFSNDSAMTFARRDLTPNLLVKAFGLSIRLLQASSDVESIVTERLAYKFSVAEENAYLNGSGSGQPLGIFTASASGIPTSQDVVCTAASSTTILADDLITAKYSLKQPYLASPSAGWVFSRAAVNQIRLLKDTLNRYLWVDGGGFNSAPETILGIPLYVSEYAPNTFSAGDYIGALGNFAYYRIAEVKDMEVTRLNELYQGTNEIGFIGRKWLDASPVLPEAFVRLQIHA